MRIAPEILENMTAKTNLASINFVPEWIEKMQNESRAEKRYD
jgi:hypothetical protein